MGSGITAPGTRDHQQWDRDQSFFRDQGPVSQKSRKRFGSAKPFSIVRILKTKKCIGMKLCMKGKFVHIKNM